MTLVICCAARYDGNIPDLVKGDRKVHFRTLRETVFEWQADALVAPYETWGQFEARVADALGFATDTIARRVLVVSSGGGDRTIGGQHA